MIILIFLMIIIFSVFLGLIWVWFFKNEAGYLSRLYMEGLNAIEKHDYSRAKDSFLKLNIINPNYEDTKYKYGFVLLKLKEYPAAKDCFEQILKASPKHFDALFGLAQVFQFQKNYDKAEELYYKALKEHEKSLECYFNLGLIFYNQKDFTKAMEFFEKAKEISPEDARVLFYINKCSDELCDYETEEEPQTIIEEYLRIADEPDLPIEFNISLAKAYAKTGQINEALIYCQNSLVINTEDVESYKLLGLLQFLKKDFVGAKNNLSTALHLQSKNKEVHEILSYVLCQQKDKCSAKKCREKYHDLIKKFL